MWALFGPRGQVFHRDPLPLSLSWTEGGEILGRHEAGGSRWKEGPLSHSPGQFVLWKVSFNLFHMNREKHETFRALS